MIDSYVNVNGVGGSALAKCHYKPSVEEKRTLEFAFGRAQ